MIKKIYHISDIHIRNFKRHDEYRRVFDQLYSYLKKVYTKEDLICLTGDIVHSKTDVTPELVQEVQFFLKSVSDIGKVLLIPGNHDANLNNSHRLDALTPIVNALNHENLIYVKDTKVFEIDGITFCHWSVFDNPVNYLKSYQLEGLFDNKLKICLYHGLVSGIITEFGFNLFNNDVKVEDFDGYDLVLLGDIHKTQFLNEQKTIGYPGSLIQQNHAEGLTHGIFVWDTETKSAEFIEVKNDTAFYTLEVDSNNYDPIPSSLPKNIYLRIKYKNTNQSEIKRIVSDIKQKYNVLETSLIRIKDNIAIQNSGKNLNLTDVRNIEYQNLILSQYLKDKFDLDSNTIKDVCEINKNLNNRISKLEVPRNSVWVPKSFEFSDMFSYGKNNVIDFSNMQGVYGIFAPNASGKSTLLDSITYCIFDKCSKTGKASQVMNNNSKTFHCKLVFELNGIEYTIERRAETQKLGNVKVNVDFYYMDENEHKVSLNGKERSDTNKSITSLLGSYEDFVLTTISVQNNNTGFIDMNQKDRKDLLAQFLDINVFEELYLIANNEIREISVLLKEYQKEDYFDLLKQSDKLIKNYSTKLEDSKKIISEIENKRDYKNNEILEETKKLSKIEEVEDLDYLQEQKDKTQSLKLDVENNIISLSEDINKKEGENKILEEEIADLDIDRIEKGLVELKEKVEEKNQKALEQSTLKARVNSMKTKLDQLKDLEYDPNCKFCMENVFVKDAIEIKNTFPEQEEKLNTCNLELKSINDQVLKLKDFEKTKKTYEEKTKSLQKSLNEVNKLKLDLSKLESKVKQAKNILDTIENKIELYNKQQNNIEANKNINNKIDLLNKELDSINKELKKHNESYTDIVANKKLEENNKIKYQSSILKLKELEDKYKFYQYYLDAVHRDGLPHKLISNTIPQIEEEINNILAQLVDFSIVLRPDDKNINAYIAYDEENYWPIELTSGMEKFISSLAIRTSLINVSTLPRPNFMAIDEGFGALDQTNLNSIVMLFDYLKTQFKFIMIISHIDSMRDVVDHHIEINKVDGKSKIEQVD